MKKYVTEFIGTFFLVLTIGCTVIGGGTGVIPPLAIGMTLAVMIFAGGHISGGHYNPAVTLAVWMRGRCAASDVIPYMLAQFAAGIAATFTVRFLRAGANISAPLTLPAGTALLGEFLFTFALAYVVLNVATAKANAGNSFYGLAIGMTVLAGAFSVGNISGGAFNPAVGIAVCMLGLTSWSSLWVYLVGNFAGGALAALIFKGLNPEDR